MAHDQQAAEAKDARVVAAAAHWGHRFTSNGTDYGDVTATLARITRWADWCREWGVTATRYGCHGVTNLAYESRSRMADWLAAKLR